MTITARLLHAGFTLIVALLMVPAVRAQPRIRVDLARPQIYEGESVVYQVTIENAGDAVAPRVTSTDDFTVRELGQESRLEDINGVVATSVGHRYLLTPKRSGTLRIPAPVVQTGGTVLRGRELTLQVTAPPAQDLARLTITSDRNRVYPTQPFTVTLTVHIKDLPPGVPPLPNGDPRSPLSVQQTPVSLVIPWAQDKDLPAGIKPEIPWQQWLDPLLSRGREGFSVNSLGRSGYLLSDRQLFLFHPTPQKVRLPDGAGNDASYWEFRFERSFTARTTGTCSFGPAKLKGAIGVKLAGPTQLTLKNVYALARPIEIEVIEVPQQGRPDSFTGAVGKFSLSAELLPTKARVGDPMTLTLAIAGRGTLESTVAPNLTLVPQIADNFKIHDATQETTGDTRRFTYTVRPQTADITEFPAVPVSYFDVDAGRYITLQSKSIPIEVSVAEKLSDSDIIAPQEARGSLRQQIRASSEGVFANVTDLRALRNESVRPGRWLAGLLGLVGLYVAVVFVSRWWQHAGRDFAGQRRRGAPARARARLKELAAATGSRQETADLARAAVTGLVADTADLPESGLTSRDIRRQLTEYAVDTDLVDRVDELLKTCDAARYGTHQAGEELHCETKTVVEQLISALKAQKRFR